MLRFPPNAVGAPVTGQIGMVDDVDPPTAEVRERLATKRIRAFINHRRHLATPLRVLIHCPRKLFRSCGKGIAHSRLHLVVFPLADRIPRMQGRLVALALRMHQQQRCVGLQLFEFLGHDREL
jgi:hypothetical protein